MMPAPHSADLRWRVIRSVMLSRGQLAVRKAVSVGSLNKHKHDVDGSENVIWKCHFAFLQSSFNYSKWLCLKKCALLTILPYPGIKLEPALGTRQNWTFVHLTAKKVISRHRKNENVFKMSKDEKCTCKACTNTVFHCQVCKFVGFRRRGCLSRTRCFCKPNMEPQCLSVVQFPFDNCHSPFSPTTFFEIGVYTIMVIKPLMSAMQPWGQANELIFIFSFFSKPGSKWKAHTKAEKGDPAWTTLRGRCIKSSVY